VTINALFRKLKDIVGFEGQAIYLNDRPQEVKNAFCSSAKARDLLGYRTTHKLDDGLRDIVEYIRQVGPRKFRYHLDIEIRNDHTPSTWLERLM
jgi:UDP-glucose 4-epimerase